MAKLVGYQDNAPVQAAAGLTVEKALLSPSGVALLGGTIVAGWTLGTILGQAIKAGDDPMDATAIVPGHLPSDVEEFISLWATAGASVLSWQVLEQVAKEVGWKALGLYTLGLGAVVAYRRYG